MQAGGGEAGGWKGIAARVYSSCNLQTWCKVRCSAGWWVRREGPAYQVARAEACHSWPTVAIKDGEQRCARGRCARCAGSYGSTQVQLGYVGVLLH